jgi:transcriptional/translational regulatory protein YebC/TACO1
MAAKKTKPEPDNNEQFARFVETAKQIDNPDAKEAFEEAMNKIAKKKKLPPA